MYKVVHKFRDLKDNMHQYLVGDEYPRKGAKVDDKRIAELLGKANKLHRPLIEEIIEKPVVEEVVEEKPEEKPKKKRKSSRKKVKE